MLVGVSGFCFHWAKGSVDTAHELIVTHPHSSTHYLQSPQATGFQKDMSPPSFSGSRDELDKVYPRLDKNASIEQLLSEIEREYGGPDYRYTPPRDEADTSGQTNQHSAKTNLRSTRDGQISTENYDILQPTARRQKYDLLLPPSTTSSTLSPLTIEERFKYHHYESLSPRSPLDDGDTYVYMAPRRQLERAGSLPVESRNER